MTTPKFFGCYYCKQAKPYPPGYGEPGYVGGTGYAKDGEGRLVCYDCCAKQDVEYMTEHGRITLYDTDKGVSNWPGTLKFAVLRRSKSRHNIAGWRYDLWFRDSEGAEWHGVRYGDMTQLVHCKRKAKQ